MLADRKMKTINHDSTAQTLHYRDAVVQLSHITKEVVKDGSCEVRH